MMRHTGGRSMGETSTKSNPASCATRMASTIGTIPNCSLFSLIRRTGEIRICSLQRNPCWLMTHAPEKLPPSTFHESTDRFTVTYLPQDSLRVKVILGLLQRVLRKCKWFRNHGIAFYIHAAA